MAHKINLGIPEPMAVAWASLTRQEQRVIADKLRSALKRQLLAGQADLGVNGPSARSVGQERPSTKAT